LKLETGVKPMTLEIPTNPKLMRKTGSFQGIHHSNGNKGLGSVASIGRHSMIDKGYSDEDNFQSMDRSHSEMSSRWTDDGTEDSFRGPHTRGEDLWSATHSEPKAIRSMRFSFNSGMSSTMEPLQIFKRVTAVIQHIKLQQGGPFTYRKDQDYYMFICRLASNKGEALIFEIEVCKVWLLKLHGVRMKRIAGDPILFKELYRMFEDSLKI
jgi:hypothetical protein